MEFFIISLFFDPFNCIIAFYDDFFFVQQEIAYCVGHGGAQRFHVEIDRC